MPWWYIQKLLGPGLHWGKSQKVFLDAIKQAEKDNIPHAAQHIRMILKLRNSVMCEDEEKDPGTKPG